MQKVTPVEGTVLVEPLLQSELRAAAYKKVGILIPKPDNKHSFEGVPNIGVIHSLSTDYKGDLKVGDNVVFNVDKPIPVKLDKLKLFSIPLEKICATIKGDQ